MADERKDTTEPADEADIPTAHPHHKDKGTVVKTAFGVTLPGEVADIADGDDERH